MKTILKHISNVITWLTGSALLILFALMLSACNEDSSAMPTKADTPFTITASLTTNRMHIGDQQQVTLRVVHPVDCAVTIPSPEDGKNIVLRNVTQQDKTIDDQFTETTYVYDITSFTPGSHVVWKKAAEGMWSNGRTTNQPIPDTRFDVVTILTDSDRSLRNIETVVNWPARSHLLTYLILGIVLLAVIIMLILLKRRNGGFELIPPAPPTPPHVLAMQALEELIKRGLIEEHLIEEFYVAVSDIVRTYLEDRFNLRAPEQTTEEFIHETVNSRMLSSEHQQVLRDFLEQCDLVKFARHEPGEQDMHNAYDAAKHFVLETQPAPQEVKS